jgi:hypothetical protein
MQMRVAPAVKTISGRGRRLTSRMRRAAGGEIETAGALEQDRADLERRIRHLETVVEGLQDAMHRESVRRDHEIAELNRRTEPSEIARGLSEDARRRGL